MGLLALATGLASFDTKLLPMPVTGLGILAGVLLICIPAMAVAIIGLICGALWVIAASVRLMRRPAATS